MENHISSPSCNGTHKESKKRKNMKSKRSFRTGSFFIRKKTEKLNENKSLEKLVDSEKIHADVLLSSGSTETFSVKSGIAILHSSYTADEHDTKFPSDRLDKSYDQHETSEDSHSMMTENKNSEHMWLSLPDDPTVKESLECVFSHQLESGNIVVDVGNDFYSSHDGGDEDASHEDNIIHDTIPSTSTQMSADSNLTESGKLSIIFPFLEQKQRNVNGKPINIMSSMFQSEGPPLATPVSNDMSDDEEATSNKNGLCKACSIGNNHIPQLPPSQWPQYPLLIRPTPGSGTRVRGVRFVDSSTYLDGVDVLQNDVKCAKKRVEFCPECCCIPINNGNESGGKTLCADFESPSFVGTLHVRIRGIKGANGKEYNPNLGYFSGVNRQYQVVIRGRFKRERIPMIECFTGQTLSAPLNAPLYLSRTALKLMKFFAPRMIAKIDGDNPILITPLGSTPQSISVDPIDSKEDYTADVSISHPLEEPSDGSRRITDVKCKGGSSSAARAKDRKRAFDKLCASGENNKFFQTNQVYTFEFLQHLADFHKFEMQLGLVGKVELDSFLNGQCLSIMAGIRQNASKDQKKLALEKIWSFDLWHKNLLS